MFNAFSRRYGIDSVIFTEASARCVPELAPGAVAFVDASAAMPAAGV
jgi:hypothetical protein